MGHDDCFSLTEIATYGLKGVCAYATHCYQLGKLDAVVMAEIHQIFTTLSDPSLDVPACYRRYCASAKLMPKSWPCSIKPMPNSLAIRNRRNTVPQPCKASVFWYRDMTCKICTNYWSKHKAPVYKCTRTEKCYPLMRIRNSRPLTIWRAITERRGRIKRYVNMCSFCCICHGV